MDATLLVLVFSTRNRMEKIEWLVMQVGLLARVKVKIPLKLVDWKDWLNQLIG